MPDIYLLNKPYQVLCQFTDTEGRKTLADYLTVPGVYAAGRLDYDSEGLLLLTDDGVLQHAISNPKTKQPKSYWVQVEGAIDEKAILALRKGVNLKDGRTLPAEADIIEEPSIWTRSPPIRERANIPTSWINLSLIEGKNRQVRRMTAAVGFPTLRLIRHKIADWSLADLQPGEWRKETVMPVSQPSKNAQAKHKPFPTKRKRHIHKPTSKQ